MKLTLIVWGMVALAPVLDRGGNVVSLWLLMPATHGGASGHHVHETFLMFSKDDLDVAQSTAFNLIASDDLARRLGESTSLDNADARYVSLIEKELILGGQTGALEPSLPDDVCESGWGPPRKSSPKNISTNQKAAEALCWVPAMDDVRDAQLAVLPYLVRPEHESGMATWVTSRLALASGKVKAGLLSTDDKQQPLVFKFRRKAALTTSAKVKQAAAEMVVIEMVVNTPYVDFDLVPFGQQAGGRIRLTTSHGALTAIVGHLTHRMAAVDTWVEHFGAYYQLVDSTSFPTVLNTVRIPKSSVIAKDPGKPSFWPAWADSNWGFVQSPGEKETKGSPHRPVCMTTRFDPISLNE